MKILSSDTTQKATLSYFEDYVLEEVIQDLMDKYGYTYEMAEDKVLKGGYRIYIQQWIKIFKIIWMWPLRIRMQKILYFSDGSRLQSENLQLCRGAAGCRYGDYGAEW